MELITLREYLLVHLFVLRCLYLVSLLSRALLSMGLWRTPTNSAPQLTSNQFRVGPPSLDQGQLG